MPNVLARIADNLAAVGERIEAAARRAGRSAGEVTLVAVTKYVGLEEVQALLEAGCRDLGESRPQQLWQKAEQLAGQTVRWHLIGHLQRNKVRRTLPHVSLLHSLDSLRLAEAIAAESPLPEAVRCLLEVNISGDESKHGFEPDDVEPSLLRLAGIPQLQVVGLMAMAAREGGPDTARANFARLRQLRDRVQLAAPDGLRLTELSMGMSGDFEAAIEEGATLVRVGSALFEGLP